MNRAFVRGLWGIYDNSRRFYKRRSKMDRDINLLKKCKYDTPFVNYVFGEENYKKLKKEGFDCRLVSKEPILWDMDKQQFRHKIEILKKAMEDFDEIVFLDYDTVPIKKLPEDFWEILSKKESIQAVLRMYKRTKAHWRKKDRRKIVCASFIYINDKKIPDKLIKKWEKMNCPWSEEVVISKMTDEMMGGWKGIDKYWDLFEPDFFVLDEGHVYSKEKLSTKNKVFMHINERTRPKVLKRKNLIGWIS